MSRTGWAILAALAPVAAVAQPGLPPTVEVPTTPRHLAMRAQPPQPSPTTTPPPPRRPRPRPRRAPATAAPTAPPPRLSAQLSLGMAIDGAGLRNRTGDSPATGTTIGGSVYTAGADFNPARAYGFGALFLSTRGLIAPSVATYLASQFRLRPAVGTRAPIVDTWDRVDPLAVRAAWADATELVATGALRTLALRAGRQFVYGPAPVHLDGLWVSWAPRGLHVAAYLGSRVPDWASEVRAADARGLVLGGELRIPLVDGPRALTARARGLRYAGHTHADVAIDWRPRPDVDLSAVSRIKDDAIAHHRATLRIRVSDETRLAIEATSRKRADWLWDYERVSDNDPTQPRRYLDLGPPTARTTVRVRAGTVLLDNIDALLFGGAALDERDDDQAPTRTSPGWLEGGSAVEMRLRRTLGLTLSGLGRIYARTDAVPAEQLIDLEGHALPLPATGEHIGERSLFEGGVAARFTGGARKFSATAEIYARRTRHALLYRDDGIADSEHELTEPLDLDTIHGGARFAFDAWITPRLRVHTTYELTNRFATAPEIAGLKALRILVEGQY